MLQSEPESTQELLQRTGGARVASMRTSLPTPPAARGYRVSLAKPAGAAARITNMRTNATAMKQGGLVDPAAVACKRGSEFDDEAGNLYSTWPLQYAAALTPPPRMPRGATEQAFVDKTLERAVKKLPTNHKLHWIDDEGVVGQRAWYNPVRLVRGRDIRGEQRHELGPQDDSAARARIAQLIAAADLRDRRSFYAHLPAGYLDEDGQAVDPAAPKVAGLLPAAKNLPMFGGAGGGLIGLYKALHAQRQPLD